MPDRTLATDRLADAVWGQPPPAAAGARVRTLVSGLRRAQALFEVDLEGHGRRHARPASPYRNG